MASGKKSSGLSKVFNMETFGKIAIFAATTAFSFAVMGALDFTLFHELIEGQTFMAAVKPLASDILRSEAMGFSIAGLFVDAASWLTEVYPGTLDPTQTALAATEQFAPGAMGGW